MAEQRQWEGTTFGNGWMHKWLIRMLRTIDLRILYAFVAVCVVPPCLLFGKSGATTYRYFRRRHGNSRWRAARNTYKNHVAFAQVVVDKFAMYAGKRFDIDIDGYDHFLDLAARSEGFVQLSSHIGNYEIAGYSLIARTKRFNALVFGGEKRSVMENRCRMFATTNINMIALQSDMSHIIEINNALADGQIMSMPADRMLGSRKTIEVELLHGKADLPLGPFSIATMRELNVLAVNVMKTGWRRYHIYVTPLSYDTGKSRTEQMRELATAYAAELDRMLTMYPEQWYNYFDFWKE